MDSGTAGSVFTRMAGDDDSVLKQELLSWYDREYALATSGPPVSVVFVTCALFALRHGMASSDRQAVYVVLASSHMESAPGLTYRGAVAAVGDLLKPEVSAEIEKDVVRELFAFLPFCLFYTTFRLFTVLFALVCSCLPLDKLPLN